MSSHMYDCIRWLGKFHARDPLGFRILIDRITTVSAHSHADDQSIGLLYDSG